MLYFLYYDFLEHQLPKMRIVAGAQTMFKMVAERFPHWKVPWQSACSMAEVSASAFTLYCKPAALLLHCVS